MSKKWIVEMNSNILAIKVFQDLLPRAELLKHTSTINRLPREVLTLAMEDHNGESFFKYLPDKFHDLIKGRYELRESTDLDNKKVYVILEVSKDEMMLLALQDSIFSNTSEYTEEMKYYTLTVDPYEYRKIPVLFEPTENDNISVVDLDKSYPGIFCNAPNDRIDFATLYEADLKVLDEVDFFFDREYASDNSNSLRMILFTTQTKMNEIESHFGENANVLDYRIDECHILNIDDYQYQSFEIVGSLNDIELELERRGFSDGTYCDTIIPSENFSLGSEYWYATIKHLKDEDMELLKDDIWSFVYEDPFNIRLRASKERFREIQEQFKRRT